MSKTEFCSVYDQVLETSNSRFPTLEGGDDCFYVRIDGHAMKITLKEE